jgi:hypothetical protein
MGLAATRKAPRMSQIDENVRQQFVEIVQDEDADDLLVRLAGEAMLAKLAKKRADGRMGWWTTNTDSTQLLADA